jgi:uncharacterized protein YndB with AHSA1/START domain
MQNLGNDSISIVTDGAELVIERIFDAPRELVWKAVTEPEHIQNWWGPYGTTTTVVEMDVRPGGTWRFINHGPDGQDAPFKGEYLEVVPPERIVQTFIFDVEGFNDQAAIETMTLEALDGRTRILVRSRYPSEESLIGAMSSGMARGVIETYDRLDQLLTGMAANRG